MQTRNEPGKMIVVGFRPAELIVRHWAKLIVLHEATPAIVTHQNVELTVRTESEHAAVMIAAQGLIGISLKRMQLDQIAIERKSRRLGIPNVTIDSVAEQRDVGKIRRVNSGAALGPIQIDVSVESKIRLQGDPQTATFV